MADIALTLILTATGGRVVGGDAPAAFTGLSHDSRTVQAGQLYVALKGERFDGHEFAEQAFARGVRAALVSRALAIPGVQIVVGDTVQALGAMAAAHRAAFNPMVIGVTGSIGKTTTKDMLAAILSQGWRTMKAPANFNNEIGLPLTLLGLEASHQAVVLEMAMRGRGRDRVSGGTGAAAHRAGNEHWSFAPGVAGEPGCDCGGEGGTAGGLAGRRAGGAESR